MENDRNEIKEILDLNDEKENNKNANSNKESIINLNYYDYDNATNTHNTQSTKSPLNAVTNLNQDILDVEDHNNMRNKEGTNNSSNDDKINIGYIDIPIKPDFLLSNLRLSPHIESKNDFQTKKTDDKESSSSIIFEQRLPYNNDYYGKCNSYIYNKNNNNEEKEDIVCIKMDYDKDINYDNEFGNFNSSLAFENNFKNYVNSNKVNKADKDNKEKIFSANEDSLRLDPNNIGINQLTRNKEIAINEENDEMDKYYKIINYLKKEEKEEKNSEEIKDNEIPPNTLKALQIQDEYRIKNNIYGNNHVNEGANINNNRQRIANKNNRNLIQNIAYNNNSYSNNINKNRNIHDKQHLFSSTKKIHKRNTRKESNNANNIIYATKSTEHSFIFPFASLTTEKINSICEKGKTCEINLKNNSYKTTINTLSNLNINDFNTLKFISQDKLNTFIENSHDKIKIISNNTFLTIFINLDYGIYCKAMSTVLNISDTIIENNKGDTDNNHSTTDEANLVLKQINKPVLVTSLSSICSIVDENMINDVEYIKENILCYIVKEEFYNSECEGELKESKIEIEENTNKSNEEDRKDFDKVNKDNIPENSNDPESENKNTNNNTEYVNINKDNEEKAEIKDKNYSNQQNSSLDIFFKKLNFCLFQYNTKLRELKDILINTTSIVSINSKIKDFKNNTNTNYDSYNNYLSEINIATQKLASQDNNNIVTIKKLFYKQQKRLLKDKYLTVFFNNSINSRNIVNADINYEALINRKNLIEFLFSFKYTALLVDPVSRKKLFPSIDILFLNCFDIERNCNLLYNNIVISDYERLIFNKNNNKNLFFISNSFFEEDYKIKKSIINDVIEIVNESNQDFTNNKEFKIAKDSKDCRDLKEKNPYPIAHIKNNQENNSFDVSSFGNKYAKKSNISNSIFNIKNLSYDLIKSKSHDEIENINNTDNNNINDNSIFIKQEGININSNFNAILQSKTINTEIEIDKTTINDINDGNSKIRTRLFNSLNSSTNELISLLLKSKEKKTLFFGKINQIEFNATASLPISNYLTGQCLFSFDFRPLGVAIYSGNKNNNFSFLVNNDKKNNNSKNISNSNFTLSNLKSNEDNYNYFTCFFTPTILYLLKKYIYKDLGYEYILKFITDDSIDDLSSSITDELDKKLNNNNEDDNFKTFEEIVKNNNKINIFNNKPKINRTEIFNNIDNIKQDSHIFSCDIDESKDNNVNKENNKDTISNPIIHEIKQEVNENQTSLETNQSMHNKNNSMLNLLTLDSPILLDTKRTKAVDMVHLNPSLLFDQSIDSIFIREDASMAIAKNYKDNIKNKNNQKANQKNNMMKKFYVTKAINNNNKIINTCNSEVPANNNYKPSFSNLNINKTANMSKENIDCENKANKKPRQKIRFRTHNTKHNVENNIKNSDSSNNNNINDIYENENSSETTVSSNSNFSLNSNKYRQFYIDLLKRKRGRKIIKDQKDLLTELNNSNYAFNDYYGEFKYLTEYVYNETSQNSRNDQNEFIDIFDSYLTDNNKNRKLDFYLREAIKKKQKPKENIKKNIISEIAHNISESKYDRYLKSTINLINSDSEDVYDNNEDIKESKDFNNGNQNNYDSFNKEMNEVYDATKKDVLISEENTLVRDAHNIKYAEENTTRDLAYSEKDIKDFNKNINERILKLKEHLRNKYSKDDKNRKDFIYLNSNLRVLDIKKKDTINYYLESTNIEEEVNSLINNNHLTCNKLINKYKTGINSISYNKKIEGYMLKRKTKSFNCIFLNDIYRELERKKEEEMEIQREINNISINTNLNKDYFDNGNNNTSINRNVNSNNINLERGYQYNNINENSFFAKYMNQGFNESRENSYKNDNEDYIDDDAIINEKGNYHNNELGLRE